jgi:hypothetical protein
MDLIEIGQMIGRVEEGQTALRHEFRAYTAQQAEHNKILYGIRDEVNAMQNRVKGIRGFFLTLFGIFTWVFHAFKSSPK